MQNVLVSVSYDTSRNSRSATAYTVDIGKTDRPVTDKLVQQGPVWNGITSYQGVFTRTPDAVRAVFEYVGTPSYLLRTENVLTGENRVHLLPPSERLSLGHGVRGTLLGRRTASGTYVSEQV